jgi:hypothetical protein
LVLIGLLGLVVRRAELVFARCVVVLAALIKKGLFDEVSVKEKLPGYGRWVFTECWGDVDWLGKFVRWGFGYYFERACFYLG